MMDGYFWRSGDDGQTYERRTTRIAFVEHTIDGKKKEKEDGVTSSNRIKDGGRGWSEEQPVHRVAVARATTPTVRYDNIVSPLSQPRCYSCKVASGWTQHVLVNGSAPPHSIMEGQLSNTC